MVCVGACAPTHTIFALLYYLDLSRYEKQTEILAIFACLAVR